MKLFLACVLSLLFTIQAVAGFRPVNGGMVNQQKTVQTASSATVFAATSDQVYIFEGTQPQTALLPPATSLPIDWWYELVNNSSNNVLVEDGSGAALATLVPGQVGHYQLAARASSAGTWKSWPWFPASLFFAKTDFISSTVGASDAGKPIKTNAQGRVDASFLPALVSPLTTKGDLFGFSTQNDRFPIGTDGFLLTVDSTQPFGYKWAASPSSGINQLTGDVAAGPGSGSQAATIQPLAVTNAKIANSTIDLTTKVTGVLPYANGGTNANTSWTLGSVLFAGGSNFAQDNANFFWDSVNHNLLIGMTTQAGVAALAVKGTNSTMGGVGIYPPSGSEYWTFSAAGTSFYLIDPNSNRSIFNVINTGQVAWGLANANGANNLDNFLIKNANGVGATSTTFSVGKSAGQTGDLTDWYDTDGLTKLALINAAGKIFGTGLDSQSSTITNVATPSAGTDAANKTYVDNAVAQLNPAAAVTAASTASITGTYTNAVGGVCIGDTFRVTSTAAFVVDGITPTVGQRILFKNQASGFQNGVWTLTTAANVGILGALLTRALDWDTSADMNAGNLIPVISGTTNANTVWYQTSVITTCNSDSQVYTQFVGGAGTLCATLTKSANYSVQTSDFNSNGCLMIYANCSSKCTMTAPSPTASGRRLKVKMAGVGETDIAATVDGDANGVKSTVQYTGVEIDDIGGSEWSLF